MTLQVLPPITPETLQDDMALRRLEMQFAVSVHEMNDEGHLLDALRNAATIATYLATRKGAQGPMLGIQRRIEARIGEILGPAVNRGPATLGAHPRLRELREDERADFRILARAYDDVTLTDEEWRYPRQTVVRAVRLKLGLIPETPPLPTGQFATIVADPPWQLDTGPGFGATGQTGGHVPLDYFSMTIEDIAALDIAPHVPDDAHLYLWTPNRYVEAAYGIARDWGFRPSVLLVWAKPPLGIGLGDAFKLTTEFVLFARRGSLANLDITPTTWFDWPRGRHSVKPDGFYALVERMSPGPRLDMFARRARPGWTVWGDEAPDD